MLVILTAPASYWWNAHNIMHLNHLIRKTELSICVWNYFGQSTASFLRIVCLKKACSKSHEGECKCKCKCSQIAYSEEHKHARKCTMTVSVPSIPVHYVFYFSFFFSSKLSATNLTCLFLKKKISAYSVYLSPMN